MMHLCGALELLVERLPSPWAGEACHSLIQHPHSVFGSPPKTENQTVVKRITEEEGLQ